jgi:hypothetical protein
MEYTIHDLERIVGYREECQRQISTIKQQIESLQNALNHAEPRWRRWSSIEDSLRREGTLRRMHTVRREDTEPPVQQTESEYFDAKGLEALTGTKASTWRYWANIGEGLSRSSSAVAAYVCSHRRVEPSISVNKIVTTPEGAAAVMASPRPTRYVPRSQAFSPCTNEFRSVRPR